jgi:hypothetical protein
LSQDHGGHGHRFPFTYVPFYVLVDVRHGPSQLSVHQENQEIRGVPRDTAAPFL